ncbi:hypothetical protein [Leptolyngbya sp. AN10]
MTILHLVDGKGGMSKLLFDRGDPPSIASFGSVTATFNFAVSDLFDPNS